jgi:GDP-4-dehydro-6-deoxy-D-mannose reductase
VRALVTGVNGFAGTHLRRRLLDEGVEVYGTVHPQEVYAPEGGERIFVADVRSPGALRRVVRRAGADVVYHLAALSFVPSAQEDPRGALEANVLGSLNVMEAVRSESPKAKIILPSSSDVYGRVLKEDLPITEDTPVAPLNVYAATKASMELFARVYSLEFNLRIVILRLFNHIGPGQRPSFVCSNFAMQVARIECGEQEPVISVGNLASKRDFTDVRDIARAYWLAGDKIDANGCYNVSSGQAHSIEEVVEILKGLAKVDFEVRREPSRMRKTDVSLIVGSSERFRSATGWRPEIAFETTVEDTLEWWRGRVRKNPKSQESRQ